MSRTTSNVWHIQGKASAGIQLHYWIEPKGVSFTNLEFGEGACPTTEVTGIYVGNPGHAQNYFGPILDGNITTGCRVYLPDHAGTITETWGDGGTMVWNIPTHYITNGNRTAFGSTQVHRSTIQANGTAIQDKENESGTAALNDPTSGY